MENDATLEGRLRIWVKSRGWSLKKLAEQAGLDYAHLTQLSDSKPPGGKIIKALSDLGLGIDWLLTGTGKMERERSDTEKELPLPLEVLRRLPRIPNPTTSEEGARMLAAWSDMIEQVAERAAEKAVEKYRRGASHE